MPVTAPTLPVVEYHPARVEYAIHVLPGAGTKSVGLVLDRFPGVIFTCREAVPGQTTTLPMAGRPQATPAWHFRARAWSGPSCTGTPSPLSAQAGKLDFP